MKRLSSKYAYLFDKEDAVAGDARRKLQHRQVCGYRTRLVKAGDVLEVALYPIWNTQEQVNRAKQHSNPEAQRKQNRKDAIRRLIWKLNANFTAEDLHITLTYAPGTEPTTEEQARRDMKNLLRRIRRYLKREHLPDLKRYLYVIEWADAEGKATRVHHHLIIQGMDRKVVEDLWGKGYANADRLQPDEHGLEALGRYLSKGRNSTGEGKRRRAWACSKGLKQPEIQTVDHKVSRRKVEELATDCQGNAPEIFNGLFNKRGYRYNGDCVVRTSPYVAGAYITATLHRDPQLKQNATKAAGSRRQHTTDGVGTTASHGKVPG